MNEPLIEKKTTEVESLAERFDIMAARIRLNKTDSFGGAFVIIPPLGGGESMETFILDNREDPAQFWTILKTKAQMMIDAVDMAARNQNAFPRR